MPSAPYSIVSYLRVVTAAWREDTREDAELLTRFAEARDEAAFATLVWRHGQLVWRTCRHILGETSDAEDVFQSTFLALALKAGRFPVESLAGWLHRTARRAALNAQASARRRQGLEQRLKAIKQPEASVGGESRAELYAALDEELSGLPEKLRVPLLLHYLEGKSQVEVARLLGCGRSVLQRRLTRGEAILRERLERRGLAVDVGSIAVLLGGTAGALAMPTRLICSTARAAAALRSGTLTGGAAEAARTVLGTLSASSLETTMLRKSLWIMLACCLGLGGAGLAACRALNTRSDELAVASPADKQAVERPAQEGNEPARTDRYGDPLPAGALARMGTTRLRHGWRVARVLFAPDGKTVASEGGSRDGTVRLWDLATGKLVRSLKCPRKAVAHGPVFFARDGKTLVSTNSTQLWLWDVRTGEQLREMKLKKLEKNQYIFLQAISSDGKMAAGLEDKVIRLWDLATGNPLRVLEGHEKHISLAFFSPDNKTLVSADESKEVVLWDVSSGKLLHKLEHPLKHVRTVAFSPDSKTLALGGNDESEQGFTERNSPSAVRLWEVATGKLLHILKGHQNGIASLSFSPNSKVLASGSADRTIRLWDVTAGKELRKWEFLKGPPVSFAFSLSFAPDGKVLASGGGPAVCLWDVTTGEELHRLGEVHTDPIHSISFSPDGRTLATGAALGGEAAIRLWDAASGKPLRKLEHPGGARSVVFAPDGKILASGGAGVACLWDATTGILRRKLEAPGGSPLAFSPDGKLLAVAESSGILRLWDVATGKQLRTLEHAYPMSMTFSPDGKTLAMGTQGSTLLFWDAVTGKELRKVDKSKEGWSWIVALSYSPNGKTLAVGSYDCKIHLLEVSTGKEFRTLIGHSGRVSAVAFSPSGRLLASGNDDQTVRLWDVYAGPASECHQFRGHEAPVSAVAFSSDGQRLVSGSHDSTALVWDVTGRLDKGRLHPAQLSAGELEGLWSDLASDDAGRAYRAIWTLAAAPAQAVPFLEKHLRPAPGVDPAEITRLIACLDNDTFAVRQKARSKLMKLGEGTEPALRKALAKQPPLEMRRSLQELLSMLEEERKTPSKDVLRGVRAVEVLEQIGTSKARHILEGLSRGAPGVLQREAQATLERLSRK